MKRSQATDDTPGDLRWQRLADAEAAGEATPAEAEFVRDHRGEGDPTRAEQELLEMLRERGRIPEPKGADLDRDEALIAAAVNAFLATPSSSRPPRGSARRWRPRVLLGGLSAGLAAAASWLLIASPAQEVPEDSSTAPTQVAEALPSPMAEDPAGMMLLRGPALRSGRPLEEDEALALSGAPIELGAGACLGIPGRLRACAPPAPTSPAAPELTSVAEVTLRGSALNLDRGRLEVAIEAAAPEVGVVWVRVAGVALLGDSPGALTLRREESFWELRAEEGPVHLEIDGEARTLAAGEVLSNGSPGASEPLALDERETAEGPDDLQQDPPGQSTADPERRPPTSDPRELLAQAQRLRGSGDLRGAARAYRRLIRDHRDTSLAVTAQASLGQLYLGPLKSPSRALRAFRAYLRAAPRGAMAEEALRGEIDALRSLGQDKAARRSSAEFLRRFPRSGHAEGIRRDLEADGT